MGSSDDVKKESSRPGAFRPQIPRVWDEQALVEMELPVVNPKYSPKPVSADYYYKIAARTIYKSYPIYAPARAPSGYLEKLKTLAPEVIFVATKLNTKEDWIRAGEVVFEAPSGFEVPDLALPDVCDPAWYEHTRVRLTKHGASCSFPSIWINRSDHRLESILTFIYPAVLSPTRRVLSCNYAVLMHNCKKRVYL